MSFIDFLLKYYIFILAVLILLILIVIGVLVDSKSKGKEKPKSKKKEKVAPETITSDAASSTNLQNETNLQSASLAPQEGQGANSISPIEINPLGGGVQTLASGAIPEVSVNQTTSEGINTLATNAIASMQPINETPVTEPIQPVTPTSMVTPTMEPMQNVNPIPSVTPTIEPMQNVNAIPPVTPTMESMQNVNPVLSVTPAMEPVQNVNPVPSVTPTMESVQPTNISPLPTGQPQENQLPSNNEIFTTNGSQPFDINSMFLNNK